MLQRKSLAGPHHFGHLHPHSDLPREVRAAGHRLAASAGRRRSPERDAGLRCGQFGLVFAGRAPICWKRLRLRSESRSKIGIKWRSRSRKTTKISFRFVGPKDEVLRQDLRWPYFKPSFEFCAFFLETDQVKNAMMVETGN